MWNKNIYYVPVLVSVITQKKIGLFLSLPSFSTENRHQHMQKASLVGTSACNADWFRKSTTWEAIIPSIVMQQTEAIVTGL